MPGSSPGMTSVFVHTPTSIQTARRAWTQLRDLAAQAARVCCKHPALKTKGAGNAGRSMRPQPRVQNKTKHTSIVTTVTAEITRHSRTRMVLTVSFALSPVTGLVCHRRPQEALLLKNLTPASGRQDHTTSPSASRAIVESATRVHRIPRPTSVTIAKRPSCGTGWRRYGCDLGETGRDLFLKEGLDR